MIYQAAGMVAGCWKPASRHRQASSAPVAVTAATEFHRMVRLGSANSTQLLFWGLQRNLWVKMIRKSFGLMENDAPVEIRKKRGFPPPLGKLTPRSGVTFPHFPQAPPGVFAFRI
jgi:hypothetical protein